MMKYRNLCIAALACVAVLSVAATAPATPKSKRIYTADQNEADGRIAGHARYTTRAVKNPDIPGELLTRVALKACDTQEDGYGIVATIWQHGLKTDEVAARKGVFTCSRKHVYRLRGKVELRVCAHDKDNNVGSGKFGYVACSPITEIANN